MLFLPFSALDKLLNFQGAVGQCRSVFKPKPLAVLVILGGLAIEVFTSLAIITGFADRLGAVVLAVYCAITAVLFKQFWKPGDFWSRADGQGRNLFWDFLKNFALGGALLLLASALMARMSATCWPIRWHPRIPMGAPRHE